jgi:branched-chain amino acid transport system ATP-binding protein
MTMFADWPVFLGLTLVIFGGASWLSGAAIATTWRSCWQVVGYGLLLALFDRFLNWALFGGDLFSPSGLARDYAVILAVGCLSWRLRYVGRMVNQYPWLYVRSGLLNWQRR